MSAAGRVLRVYQKTNGGKMKISKFMVPPLATCLSGASAFAADVAKDYPDRPIRLIVPNGPGSAVDTLTRIVAAKLGDVLGPQIVVGNRAGARGAIAQGTAQN